MCLFIYFLFKLIETVSNKKLRESKILDFKTFLLLKNSFQTILKTSFYIVFFFFFFNSDIK